MTYSLLRGTGWALFHCALLCVLLALLTLGGCKPTGSGEDTEPSQTAQEEDQTEDAESMSAAEQVEDEESMSAQEQEEGEEAAASEDQGEREEAGSTVVVPAQRQPQTDRLVAQGLERVGAHPRDRTVEPVRVPAAAGPAC